MSLLIEYIFLGVLQGLFEWLPVSSEGIVSLATNLLNLEVNPVDMGLFLHLGTVLAVFVYFSKDWKQVLLLRNKELFRFLVLSTLISLAIGYPIYKVIRNVSVGNSLLFLVGVGLLFTAYFHKKKKTWRIGEDKLAAVTGFLQGLSVIPGLSRSGSTIFGLSLGKSDNLEILKTSYMMSVPVGLASGLYVFLNNSGIGVSAWPSLVSSFVVGILSLKVLINVSQKIDFFWFVLIFSILCFIGGALGLIYF